MRNLTGVGPPLVGWSILLALATLCLPVRAAERVVLCEEFTNRY